MPRRETVSAPAVADPESLAEVADTFVSSRDHRASQRGLPTAGSTAPVCVPGSTQRSQRRSGFVYNYSVYQVEYSRNLLFASGAEMDRVFNTVVDRTRSRIDVRGYAPSSGSNTVLTPRPVLTSHPARQS